MSFELYRPRAADASAATPFPRDHIRTACPSDSDAIVALISERHGTPRSHVAARIALEFKAMVRGEPWALHVAEVDGRVVAFGRTRLHAEVHGSEEHPAPPGWYLMGVIVEPAHRRCGIGAALTRARLAWIAQWSSNAYYFANAENRASIDLHAAFGFEPLQRPFGYPRADLDPADGVLFRTSLPGTTTG